MNKDGQALQSFTAKHLYIASTPRLQVPGEDFQSPSTSHLLKQHLQKRQPQSKLDWKYTSFHLPSNFRSSHFTRRLTENCANSPQFFMRYFTACSVRALHGLFDTSRTLLRGTAHLSQPALDLHVLVYDAYLFDMQARKLQLLCSVPGHLCFFEPPTAVWR